MATVPTESDGREVSLARAGLVGGLGVLAFLAAALFNGFPLVYPDTGTYLEAAATLQPPLDRPIFYSLFLRATQSLVLSPWATVAAQALLLVWLLRLLIDRVRPDLGPRREAGLLLLLAAGTGLPWISGQLMPDIFTGYLAVAFYLFLFHSPTLGSARFPLGAVFVSCLFVHTSNIAITALLLGLLFLDPSLRLRLRWPAALLAVALVAIPAANRLCGGRFSLSSWGHNFLMIRLTEDGLVERLLRDRCAQRRYVLCAHEEELKTKRGEQYLFDPASPLEKIGGWEGSAGVTWPILADAWLRYPGRNLKSLGAGFVRQFFGFRGGLSKLDRSTFLYQAIRKHHPAQLEALERSRQMRGALSGAVEALHSLHWLLALAALLVLSAFALASGLRVQPQSGDLSRFLLLFFAANAAVCSSLSHASARFQWRIAWLLVLGAALLAPDMLRFLAAARGPEERPARGGKRGPQATVAAVSPWRAAGLAAGLAAGVFASSMAGAWLVSRGVVMTETSLYSYLDEPVATWPGPDKFRRRIPRATLGNPAGLQAGAMMKARTVSGREFIGTVSAVGAEDITVDYSWETVRWSTASRSPARTTRRLPRSGFPPGIELKPGARVQGFAEGTIKAIEGELVTVEFGS